MKLLPGQKKAVEQLHNGSILCGGTGSGKSITAIAYFVLKVIDGGFSPYKPGRKPVPLYIITTAKKRDTLEWEGELAKFGLSTHPDVGLKVVVSSWNKISSFEDVKGCFFIFDEQRVVGNGAWVSSFLKIAQNNRWILLSATPGDVWMDYVPVFLANGFYKNRTEFYNRHVIFSRFTKYPSVQRYIDTDRLEFLRSRILVDIKLDRTVTKVHHDEIVAYDKALYDEIQDTRFDPWKKEPIKDAGGLCRLLRQVSNTGLGRYERVLQLCKERKRLIIFYSFDYELEMLRRLRNDLSCEVAECNGHRHDRIPPTEEWVYLVQYAAGAEGWNCISTDSVLFFSPTYSYRQQNQAEGRIDRLNTPYDTLHYYHMRSESSIDRVIARAQREKKDFNEKAFVKGLQIS